jgi:hypothetical protein
MQMMMSCNKVINAGVWDAKVHQAINAETLRLKKHDSCVINHLNRSKYYEDKILSARMQ